MQEGTLRHFVCAIATLCFALVYWAAYISGVYGWWLTFIGIPFIYMFIYKLTGGGGGGHH